MKKEPRRTTNNDKQANGRLFGMIFYFLMALMFIWFAVRFAQIGLIKHVNHVNLRSRAAKISSQKQVIHAKRGVIYDANGNALAQDTNRYTVYAVLDHRQKTPGGKPLYVTDKGKAAKVLSKYLHISKDKAYQTLNPHKKTFQVEFGNAGANLSIRKMKQLRAAHVNGLHFLAVPARQYPQGEFASQLVGLATPKSNQEGQTTLVGQLGLENVFNKQLTGRNGYQSGKHDVYGYRVNQGRGGIPAKNGDDVHLTLEEHPQQMLETQLNNVEKQTKSLSMMGIVMDAKTGKIIAATQRPDMYSNPAIWRNMMVQDTYEPGSTMKVLTLAAAIDSGHFDPDATYNSGTWTLGGGKITDWVPTGWGAITYRDAFYRSSNVGFAHIEQNMGSQTWHSYIHKFGLLKPVNVWGMNRESNGFTTFKGSLTQANTAYGQGITVNAMQMMQAFSAVVNNGKMMKPYFVKSVTKPNGKVVQKGHPQQVGKPIKASTAKQVRKMMVGVVEDQHGTGQAYKIDGQHVAVKTGTAQIGTAHGYENGATSYIYSVVGMAPVNKPRYVVYLVMRQPQKLPQAAEVELASIFKPLMSYLIQRQQVGSSGRQGLVKLADYRHRNANNVQSELSAKHLQPVVVGSGTKVQKQSQPADKKVMVKSRVILYTGGTIKMPSLTNWSQADVVRLGRLIGIKVKVHGSGFVSDQSIKENNTVHLGQTLTVKCKPR